MWRPLYPDAGEEDEVPIGHVTNGVHVGSWLCPPMRELLDRYLPEGWLGRPEDPAVWAAVKDIPDEELWATRSALRTSLVEWLRDRAANDRLAREEPSRYVHAAATAFDPDGLTVGFARRVAAYKRLTLLVFDPVRVGDLLDGPAPIQVVLSGKAHSHDDEAKRRLRELFELRWRPEVASRVAYVEDYDMGVASQLVSGCDVWVNLPRPPLEASGTSGMKSALNGGLNVSVLDGWWEEAWDETNGWGIPSDVSADPELQDRRDATAFYDTMDREVIPMFFDRDDRGVPREWIQRVKRSLITVGPRFSATRMMQDYLRTTYAQ
jgi:starch phosphorylase